MPDNHAAGAGRLDWLDPLKAFALIGVLLNHFVEQFGRGPWFTNPTNTWPDLATRLDTWPSGPVPVALVRWLGWLGDSGPGVFIFASGVGLAFAAARLPAGTLQPREFYRRRLLRLLPLYIASHFVILTVALVVPGETLALGGLPTLFSLLGLRFTPDLFFHINPSWWFVWTILQLYLAFPFLLRLLERRGVLPFLGITVAVTVLARGAGILFSDHLYFWMTGLFAGTRLAEFAAGMVIGWVAARHGRDILAQLAIGRLLATGLVSYGAGLLASIVLPGTLVSNLLVTAGLVGLFAFLWRVIAPRLPAVGHALVVLGILSYPIYLLHQPLMVWASTWPGLSPGQHVAATAGALALSLPLGLGLDRAVPGIPGRLAALPAGRWLALAGGAGILAALVVVEPMLSTGSLKDRLFALLLGTAGLAVALLSHGRWTFASCAALVAVGLRLFVLPPGHGFMAALFGLLVGMAWLGWGRWIRRPVLRFAAAAAVVGVMLGGTEISLRRLAPRETNVWGERPALESHRTRGYALKPNRVTRLRYNNYDYVVRTNSLGLPGPEVVPLGPTPDRYRVLVLGDAFTMPEGMSADRAYPALLQPRLARCLAPRRRVDVINAGVTGYGPREVLPLLRELAPLLRPDLVVYQFFANEFSDIRVGEDERRARIGLVRRGSRLHHIVLGSQLRARLRRLEAGVREWVAGRPAEWRYRRALLPLVSTGPNPDYAPENLDSLRVFLDAMGRTSRETGARLVIYFVPVAAAVSRPSDMTYFPRGEDLTDSSRYDLQRPLRTLRGLTDSLGLRVVDLTPYLRAYVPQPVYFPDSWHWNEEGHRAVAGAIAETLAGHELPVQSCPGSGSTASPPAEERRPPS